MRFAMTLSLVASIILAAAPAWSDPAPGEVLKFVQRPLVGPLAGAPPTPAAGLYYGHDELSTAYGSVVAGTNLLEYHGVAMADDFADIPVPGLARQPVVHVRWWGSYIGNEQVQPVDKFLIAFESDVPAGPDPATGFSHPGQVLSTQIVRRVGLPAGSPVPPGAFTERPISPGGPPLSEGLYEYNAELDLGKWFPELPDTVYWLKIVALVDVPLDYTGPLTKWGWHDRDWSVPDPLASTPPLVSPGEGILGPVVDPASGFTLPVWHFQDDAVSSRVDIFPNTAAPDMPFVEQYNYLPQHYLYAISDPNGTLLEGIDGPKGIEQYSKDLAFELYTVPEPVSLLLLLTGGAVAAAVRRRRA